MPHFYSKDNPYKHDHFIEGVAFDMDDTLYLPSPRLIECKIESAVIVAKGLSLGLDENCLRDLVIESREKYRGSLKIFAAEHGADMEKLWDSHTKELISRTGQKGIFNPASAPQDGLSKLQLSNVRVALGTHSRPNWAEHVIGELDLLESFPTAFHVTKDGVGNIGKNVGPQMCDACLDVLGAMGREDPSSRGQGYAVVEDTMENLKSFKDRGLMTVLIRRASSALSDDDIAPYVDVVAEESDMAIDSILQSNVHHIATQPKCTL